ncbi:hypothetical protein ACIOWK_33365 [Pseudomonas protegens]|uniref:hypothetical protein n=1 Tax=Pseudomonas protegens TaxID=380021 RepID=UPI0038274FAB
MAERTSKPIPARLGFALGVCARFLLRDANPLFRWVKRFALIVGATFVFSSAFTWFVSSLLSVMCIALLGLAVTKADFSIGSTCKQSTFVGWQDGPQGWGYYDMFGNCHPFEDEQ